jgi:hypothetical protein
MRLPLERRWSGRALQDVEKKEKVLQKQLDSK